MYVFTCSAAWRVLFSIIKTSSEHLPVTQRYMVGFRTAPYISALDLLKGYVFGLHFQYMRSQYEISNLGLVQDIMSKLQTDSISLVFRF